MDLRREILKEHSKAQSTNIAHWIGNDKRRFTHLMQLFLNDEYRVVQRIAWVLSMVADQYPKILLPHLSAMVEKMKEKNVPTAVKRNVVRVLEDMAIPKKLHGAVMEACFQFLADPKETIAVRCFSMTVLTNLSKEYPEIKNELRAMIEGILVQKASAGFRTRARKVLIELEKH
jgi:hypothetical protein